MAEAVTVVVVLPEVEAELDAAAGWYEDRGAGLGAALVDEVLETLDRMRARPQQFPRVGDDSLVRRALLERFPYALLFGIESEEQVVVYALAHGKRRPGYWRARLSLR